MLFSAVNSLSVTKRTINKHTQIQICYRYYIFYGFPGVGFTVNFYLDWP